MCKFNFPPLSPSLLSLLLPLHPSHSSITTTLLYLLSSSLLKYATLLLLSSLLNTLRSLLYGFGGLPNPLPLLQRHYLLLSCLWSPAPPTHAHTPHSIYIHLLYYPLYYISFHIYLSPILYLHSIYIYLLYTIPSHLPPPPPPPSPPFKSSLTFSPLPLIFLIFYTQFYTSLLLTYFPTHPT
uniref:Uncharacterized protein n=1 Tax=Galdieria sulphuraria TaxID=130081 RepID=A0A075W1T7_GALSU|nr:hypothetical protein JL72_p01 [Galdieria sulphuraria]AIG92662.1 hypothetical protein [Galdieria sulphuraria]